MQLIMSLVGMAVLIGIAVLLSSNRKAIKLRTVGGAFAIKLVSVPLYFTYQRAVRCCWVCPKQ